MSQLIRGWLDVIKAQKVSGLSIKQFCEQNNLGTSSFYKYKARLASSQSKSTVPENSPFLQAEVINEVPALIDEKIICDLGQIKVTLPTSTDPLWLAKFIGASQ